MLLLPLVSPAFTLWPLSWQKHFYQSFLIGQYWANQSAEAITLFPLFYFSDLRLCKPLPTHHCHLMSVCLIPPPVSRCQVFFFLFITSTSLLLTNMHHLNSVWSVMSPSVVKLHKCPNAPYWSLLIERPTTDKLNFLVQLLEDRFSQYHYIWLIISECGMTCNSIFMHFKHCSNLTVV